MMHVDLCTRLESAADRLTEQVLGEMYQNPFWLDRFGERAERHGRKDGRYHIDYLIQAIGSDDQAIIAHYARWLQQVLNSRGMCTRHLAENFNRLGRAIADEEWADRDVAVKMLAAATAALRYPSGRVARYIQDHTTVLAEAATQILDTRYPERYPRWPAAGRARCVDDLSYHLSYAADALALGSSATFIAYTQWVGGFLERRGIPRSHLIERFETLRAVPDAPPELQALLTEALHAFGGAPVPPPVPVVRDLA